MDDFELKLTEMHDRVLDKAATACKNSGYSAFYHFVEVNKTIDTPKTTTKTRKKMKKPPQCYQH